ncbi:MAG: hypothetical protein KGH93_01040 [Patescibacteria group bacterium]|nr:hypothetical protein [Patescibacteria group bacterium]MDE1945766.1 hypothetical protein [Patescibacteria group bacterium]
MDFFFNFKLNAGSAFLFWLGLFLVAAAVVYLVWNRYDNYTISASDQVQDKKVTARLKHAFKPLGYFMLSIIFILGIIALFQLIFGEGMRIGSGAGTVNVPTPVPTEAPAIQPQAFQPPVPQVDDYRSKHYCGVVLSNVGRPACTIEELSKTGSVVNTFPVEANAPKVVIGFNNPISGAILSCNGRVTDFRFEGKKVWFRWDPMNNRSSSID